MLSRDATPFLSMRGSTKTGLCAATAQLHLQDKNLDKLFITQKIAPMNNRLTISKMTNRLTICKRYLHQLL